MLKEARAEKQHFEKDENGDLKIKIIKLGKFPILQVFMVNENISKILIKNINFITKKSSNDIDRSWIAKVWMNADEKERDNALRQQQRLNNHNNNLLQSNYNNINYPYNGSRIYT